MKNAMTRWLVGLALLAGCSDPASDGPADAASGDDANDGGGDSLTDTADAPSDDHPSDTGLDVDPVGTAGTVDIASWNLREFPQSNETQARVADLVRALELDLVVLIEVEDPSAFQAVADDLGWQAELPTDANDEPTSVGIIYDSRNLSVSEPTLLFTDDTDTFPRPPLIAQLELLDGSTVLMDLTLIAVHLKAGTSAADEGRRRDAMVALEEHVAGLIDGAEDDDILIIGDFNEAISDPDADNVFAPWTDAPQRYRVPTLALAEEGAVSYLPAGILLDHLVTTSALDDELEGETPLLPPLDEEVEDYETVISDHLPLVIRLVVP